MRKALNRKLIEAYDLTETLLEELDYLKENSEVEFPKERDSLVKIKSSLIDEYEAISQIGILTNVAECLRDMNDVLDRLYYKQELMLKILKVHGL